MRGRAGGRGCRPWARRSALAVAVVLVGACGAGSGFPPSPPTLAVDMREYRFDYPRTFRAGRTVIRARNSGHLQHELVLVYLPPEVPPLDQQLHSAERQVVPTVVSLHSRQPGGSGTFAVDLDPGRYAFICFVEDPDGVQHAFKGMNSEFRVR